MKFHLAFVVSLPILLESVIKMDLPRTWLYKNVTISKNGMVFSVRVVCFGRFNFLLVDPHCPHRKTKVGGGELSCFFLGRLISSNGD